jgi:hypothetical protein
MPGTDGDDGAAPGAQQVDMSVTTALAASYFAASESVIACEG